MISEAEPTRRVPAEKYVITPPRANVSTPGIIPTCLKQYGNETIPAPTITTTRLKIDPFIDPGFTLSETNLIGVDNICFKEGVPPKLGCLDGSKGPSLSPCA